jgi:hypothetical protein
MIKFIILAKVCSILHLDYNDVINSGRQKAEWVWARYLCCYFARMHKQGSYKAIGEYYGNLEHATVMYAIRVVNNEIETNKFRRMEFEEIRIALEERIPKGEKPIKDNSDFYCQSVDATEETLKYQSPVIV